MVVTRSCQLTCVARSDNPSMGESILVTVRKAAKLAVYVAMIMRVKNHQKVPRKRKPIRITS